MQRKQGNGTKSEFQTVFFFGFFEKKAEENKNIARLIIPIGDVLEAKKRLNIEGSVEYAAYKNLQSRKGVNNEYI